MEKEKTKRILSSLSTIVGNYSNMLNFEKTSSSDLKKLQSSNETEIKNLIKYLNIYKSEVQKPIKVDSKNTLNYINKEKADIINIINAIIKSLTTQFSYLNNKLKFIINNAFIYKTRLQQDKKIQNEKNLISNQLENLKNDISAIRKLLAVIDNKLNKINKLTSE